MNWGKVEANAKRNWDQHMRFRAACHAMQGLLANSNTNGNCNGEEQLEAFMNQVGVMSVKLADVLLAELNKGTEV
jgi:hypothetical protein